MRSVGSAGRIAIWSSTRDDDAMTAIHASYREELEHARAIRLWLFTVAALVFAMVLVGGATRLTESGLSITEWQPLTGTLPPLNEAQWQSEFEKYQAIPQYRQLNAGMSLEFDHRMLGYVVGLMALVHLFNVARLGKPGPVFAGATLVAAAVIVQAALGIWTLLTVAALPLALFHQGTAMLALTLAIVHAATTVPAKVSAGNKY
jgi:heme A synthase